MEKVFIALGGNVGDVAETFEIAINEMEKAFGPVIEKSSLYKTEPWGNKNQASFLNMVICVETSLNAEEVLKLTLGIEKKMGRERDEDNQFAPRTIDIDILFYGEKIIDNGKIIIPHPRLHLRNFVLTPLMEIAPGLVHPSFNKKIKDLFENNTDHSLVEKI
ncbi:MAG: 2-amino-4-hydroxy-6-hydroxymethyldihydropteridine diphosphokinase [Ginsengibacter sp.]